MIAAWISQKVAAGTVSYSPPSRPLIRLATATERLLTPAITPRVLAGARVWTSALLIGEKKIQPMFESKWKAIG